MPEGATASDAKRVEAELRGVVARAPQRREVHIPGDPPMTAILAIYVAHSETLRSASTAKHHAQRLGLWAEKYKASQAQEFADHVIRDMSARIENKKTGKMEPAYAPATINRSLACAKKGLSLAWRQRLIPENYGLRIENVTVNNKREVFLTIAQVRRTSPVATLLPFADDPACKPRSVTHTCR